MTLKLGKPSLARRHFLTVAAAFGAGLAPVPAARAAVPVPDRQVFSVWRKGSRIGEHRMAFRRNADRVMVDIDIDLEIKLGFVTLYRYAHRIMEIWRDNRLVALDSETDDDGDRFSLSVRESADGLQVDGRAGRFLAPSETFPSSYWNPATIHQSQLLDTQRGHLLEVGTEQLGTETIQAGGRRIAADRYRITGGLRMDIWYSDIGQWVKMDFFTRGTTISYQLT